MRHTIVVEVPDRADSGFTETRITAAIERISWSRRADKRGRIVIDFAKVIEYHHEKMTATNDGGES